MTTASDTLPHPTRPAWLRPLVVVLILLVAGWLVSTFLGSIDWSAGQALGRLNGAQVAALMAIVAPPPGDIVVRLSLFRSWGSTRHARSPARP